MDLGLTYLSRFPPSRRRFSLPKTKFWLPQTGKKMRDVWRRAVINEWICWYRMLVQDVSGTYSKPTIDEEILQIRRLSNLNFFTLNQVLVISHAILVLLQNICVALTSSFYSHTVTPLTLIPPLITLSCVSSKGEMFLQRSCIKEILRRDHSVKNLTKNLQLY